MKGLIWCGILLACAHALASDAPPRPGITGSTVLTLNDAVAMALRNNLDIRIERSGVESARQAEVGALGYQDYVFRVTPRVQILNTPSPSVLSGEVGKSEERDLTGSVGVRKRAWDGSLFDLAFDSGRTTTNNPFYGLNPFYTSQFKVALTKPLMRGRDIDVDRATLKIRGVETRSAKLQVQLRAIDVVLAVELAYLDLAAARESVSVNREAADLARTQLEQNRRMIRAGSLAAVELAASEAELQRRLDNWYASVEQVAMAENQLKQFLAPRHDDVLWQQELVTADPGKREPQPSTDVATVLQSALRTRPELSQLETREAINRIEEKQHADAVRPALDLVASYSATGMAGHARGGPDPFTAAITPFAARVDELSAKAGLPDVAYTPLGSLAPYQSGAYGQSLATLFEGHYQSVTAGVNFEWTRNNRLAKANLEQTAIAARRLKLQRAQIEQAIEAQLRNAVQSLETARQRIAAAEAGAKAAREKLDSEQRLFANGDSTNFLVLTRQNNYSDARLRLVSARLDYAKAISRFEQASGTTLAGLGFDWEK